MDLVYDPVGGSVAVDVAGAMARDGRLLAVGFASGTWPRIEPLHLVVNNTASSVCSPAGTSLADLDRMHQRLSDLIADSPCRRGHRHGCLRRSVPPAVQSLANNAVIGKLVLDVAGLSAAPGI